MAKAPGKKSGHEGAGGGAGGVAIIAAPAGLATLSW